MAALAEAFVRIRPDTSTFQADLKKGVDRSAPASKKAGEKHGKVFGTSFVKATAGPLRGIAGVVGPSVAAAFAVIGGAKLFAGFISEGREAQKTGAQTAAVIKSTGGAAKITATQVGALATSISNKVGVDDEAIQSGANLLLTFTGIRNEAGKGNKIFDRATTVVTDMAAAMNNGEVTTQGLKSASIQVGKALNDPVKGMTALTKVGVTFTKSQKDQIAALVKSGNTLGAQKIILGELNKEFGGSAAAGTNAMDKLKVVFGNIQEQVGTALLPIIDKLASWLAVRLPGALKTVTGWFTTAKYGLQALGSAFQGEGVTSDGFVGAMERIGVQARAAFGFFQSYVLPVLKTFAAILVGTVIPALIDLGGWLVKNRSWLIPLVAGIAAMAASVYIVVTAIKVWAAVTKAFAAVQLALNLIMLANPIGLVVLAIIGLVTALVVAYKTSDRFRAIVDKAFQVVWGTIKAVWNWIKSNWPLLLGILIGPIGVATVLIIKNWAKIKAAVSAMWAGIKSAFRSGVQAMVSTFFSAVTRILDLAIRMFGWVPKLGDKLRKARTDVAGFRDSVNHSLSGIKSRSVTVTAALIASQAAARTQGGTSGSGGRVIRRALGGPVFGPGTATSDSIPAMLSRGEHVLTAREVKGFGGHDAVMAMRREVVKGFAAGGPVGFGINPKLSGLARFDKAIDSFNNRVDAMARKLAIASAGTGAGGFSPGLTGAVNFARSQAGKPYIWGAAGPGGYDCSGFVSALVNVAQGRSPYSRRFSTGTLPAGLFAGGSGPFNIGWFTGNPGHVAATINGVPMESRGGDGVVVGSRSRGAGQSIFNRHGHLIGFAAGGPVFPGDPPFDILDPRGKHFRPDVLAAMRGARSFDTGGWLPARSATVAVNNTNRAERVRTGAQDDALLAALQRTNSLLAALAPATGREVGRALARGGRA